MREGSPAGSGAGAQHFALSIDAPSMALAALSTDPAYGVTIAPATQGSLNAMIKVAAPTMALQILDDAIQAHGGGGVSQDFHLAHAWAALRTLRFADGPDEVHLRQVFRQEPAARWTVAGSPYVTGS